MKINIIDFYLVVLKRAGEGWESFEVLGILCFFLIFYWMETIEIIWDCI